MRRDTGMHVTYKFGDPSMKENSLEVYEGLLNQTNYSTYGSNWLHAKFGYYHYGIIYLPITRAWVTAASCGLYDHQ
jgi:hypothetical protein